MKVFINRKKYDINAIGEYDKVTNELIVLKGSVVSKDIKPFAGFNAVLKLRENYTTDNVVNIDLHFKSPSTAANFVNGGSSNGFLCWRNEEGIPLKKVL